MSLGEDRVRVKFNPSGSFAVAELKELTATLIDRCELGKKDAGGEVARCYSLAQTYYETAVMYAVKAATL